MIRAGILTDDKDCVGEIKIIERDGALAEADRFFHPGAAGFVAHVRTIGQIVRPKLSNEKLVKKCGFVTRSSAGVKGRGIWRCQRI